MSPALDNRDLAEVSAWLRARADRMIPTHIGQVFLIGDEAIKIKKAVDLGYLDFSTRDRRAWAIRRELELNRQITPGLYLGVEAVVRRPDGSLGLGGAGEPLEWVLRMRRFDPDAVLSHTPEKVTGDFAEALGRQIAGVHAGAEVCAGGADALAYVVQSNAGHLRTLAAELGEADVQALIEAADAEFERRRPLLQRRGGAGQLRRCHGDLHLGNILGQDDRAVLFDCIEFSDRLRELDVLYDLAFLLMDLVFCGRGEGANRVLNGYLDEAARSFGEAALEGLALLPLFLSIRAAVRTHVLARQGDQATARAYLAAAQAHLTRPTPTLHAIGGLSGAGKTTAARAMAPGLGAVVLRSDEIRKRLWGVGPRERLPAEAYAAGQSERVYARMLREAGLVLAAGRAVVLDAVFLRPEEREAAEGVAREAGVAFEGLWLQAPLEVMAQRLAARTGDASDADAAVLEDQLKRDPGAIGWKIKNPSPSMGKGESG